MTEDKFSIRDMRDLLAEFMGYGVLKIIPGRRTIYYNKPTTEKEEEFFRKQIFRFVCNQEHTDWNPFKNLSDAEQCKERLREVGKYDVIGFDYAYSKKGFGHAKHVDMDVVRVTFANSQLYRGIRGEGENELEAICNACIRFIDREKMILKYNNFYK